MPESTVTGTTIQDDALNKPATTPGMSEDWLAVLIGGFLIIATLLIAILSTDFRFTVPVYQWSTTQDLVDKVLVLDNILPIVTIGLIFFLLVAVAAKLQDGKALKFSLGFVFVYMLGIVSLIIAGNKTISSYGLEYVIFALVIGLLIGNLTK